MADIRELRTLAGWTQYELSKATGTDRTKISLAECQHVALTAEEQIRLETALLREIERKRATFETLLSGTA